MFELGKKYRSSVVPARVYTVEAFVQGKAVGWWDDTNGTRRVEVMNWGPEWSIVQPKIEAWANIYANGDVFLHRTKEGAERSSSNGFLPRRTVRLVEE